MFSTGAFPREGSVIIPHNVTYDYAKMSQEGRQLSALALYDRTVGPAVSEGMIGALSVSPECANCIAPEGSFFPKTFRI